MGSVLVTDHILWTLFIFEALILQSQNLNFILELLLNGTRFKAPWAIPLTGGSFCLGLRF